MRIVFFFWLKLCIQLHFSGGMAQQQQQKKVTKTNEWIVLKRNYYLHKIFRDTFNERKRNQLKMNRETESLREREWEKAYLEGRIWQNRSWPVVSSSFGWSLSSPAARRFIVEYKLNILNGFWMTFFAPATSHTRTIILRPLLYTEFIVLYTNIDTDRGGDW